MATIKALVIEPDKCVKEMEIENDLSSLQKIIGGYIQIVWPFDDNVLLICNEEGKLLGLEPNRPLHDSDGLVYDMVCGTIIIAGDDEESGDIISLTDEQIERYTKYYDYVCYFTDKEYKKIADFLNNTKVTEDKNGEEN